MKDKPTIDSVNTVSLLYNLPKKKWRCDKGHEFEETFPSVLICSAGNYREEYNFCPRCYMIWFKENISHIEEVSE